MTFPRFLFHYYELANGPFRNITEYGFAKAKKIQNQISKGFNSKRPENYIELRLAVEKRIKEQFISKGGKPNRNDPFYFTLGECDWAKSWYVHPGVIKIPLTDFEPGHISFTYPDSIVSFQLYDEPKLATYRKDCNGQVFMLDEMNDVIKDYGIPSDETRQAEDRLSYDKYIEAQVWDDEIINEYKNKM